MSELIRREDAINAVEMFFKDAYIEDSDVHCTDMVYEINHIPAASPWHRVEEPPEENGRYLVSWEGVVTIDEYKNGVWLYASMFNQRVTHWTMIPELPKEDA